MFLLRCPGWKVCSTRKCRSFVAFVHSLAVRSTLGWASWSFGMKGLGKELQLKAHEDFKEGIGISWDFMRLQESGFKLKQKLRFPTKIPFLTHLTNEHVDFHGGSHHLGSQKNLSRSFWQTWLSRLCYFRCLPYVGTWWDIYQSAAALGIWE